MVPTVLIVDDEQEMKDTFQGRLEFAGYTVRVAEGVGRELEVNALRIVEKERIDLAIVDMRLRDPSSIDDDSGRALIAELKTRIPDLCILAKTVYPPNANYAIELILAATGSVGPLVFSYIRREEIVSRGRLEEIVNWAFSNGVRVNFELGFDPTGVAPRFLVDSLESHSDA